MGAQMVHAVHEIIFTDKEDSILITLWDGRTIELFGDGLVQMRRRCEETGQVSIVDCVL